MDRGSGMIRDKRLAYMEGVRRQIHYRQESLKIFKINGKTQYSEI